MRAVGAGDPASCLRASPSVLCLSPWKGPRPVPPPTSAVQHDGARLAVWPPLLLAWNSGVGALLMGASFSASDAHLRGALGGGGPEELYQALQTPLPTSASSWTLSRAAAPRERALSVPSGHLELTDVFQCENTFLPKGCKKLQPAQWLSAGGFGPRLAGALDSACVLCRRSALAPSPALPCVALTRAS